MKKIWIGIIIFALVILAAVLVVTQTKKELEVIKIGVVLPLTGSAAVWGENARMGLETALEEVNDMGGVKDKKVQLFIEDSQSDPAKAVSAFQKLITIEKISVVIGDIASSNVLAMAPIAEKAKVVLLSPGASNPDISKAGEFIFRNWQSDALEGEIDAKFAYERLGYRRIAILYVNNAYGSGLKKEFEQSFQNLGGKVLISEPFEQGATDMRTQLSKVAASNPDTIYMPGYPPEMAIVLKQAKEMGLKIQFLSVQAFDDPQILETAKEAAEGVIFSVPRPSDISQPIVHNFIKKYKERFNRDPGVCSDTGYDALKIVVWAMKKADKISGPAIQRQLLNIKNFPGAAGVTTFDENGDVIKPFIFMKVQNQEFVPFD